MKICPKCEMTFSDFAEKCDFCDVDLEDYHPEKTVSEIETIYEMSQKKTSPHQRIVIKERPKPTYTSKPKSATDSNEVRCPKCGSTQITAVQRKWTFMAGFATNKVDRFCLNCKHKW